MTHLPPEAAALWVAQAKAGDRAALERLLTNVAPAILRFGLRMCKHASDADDVLQETLLYASNNLGQFEARASFSTWLFTIARTACLRKRRGAKNQAHLDDSVLSSQPSSLPNPELAAEQQQFVNLIHRALLSLSDEQREAVLLRDVEGFSARETADVLGISLEALKSRLHRGRGALRSQLQSESSPRNPNCPDIVAMWSKNLEGDLDVADCTSLAGHVSSCPSCTDACDALKAALSACQAVGAEAVPKVVQASVREAVARVLRRGSD
jgi:RNA polymerase sigma-70 factor, ECF subfamily